MKTDNSRISIALASDHRYVPGLLATMASIILSASDKSRLHFHIFANGMTTEDRARANSLSVRLGAPHSLEFHNPDMSRIQALFKPYKDSYATYLRLFLCEFLECDRIIYSDVDVLWFRDVCELWQEDCTDISICWCRDVPSIIKNVKKYSLKWNPSFDETLYACAGVMLMNLKRLRETGFVDKCVKFADRWGTPYFVDQDILNAVCFNDSRIISQYWDLMMPDPHAVYGSVVHFNGIGKMFNGPMKGWRPLFWLWYRFYYDVVLEQRNWKVCGILKSLTFKILGFAYPYKRIILPFLRPFHPQLSDQVLRQLFFAWLWRKAKWMRIW